MPKLNQPERLTWKTSGRFWNDLSESLLPEIRASALTDRQEIYNIGIILYFLLIITSNDTGLLGDVLPTQEARDSQATQRLKQADEVLEALKRISIEDRRYLFEILFAIPHSKEKRSLSQIIGDQKPSDDSKKSVWQEARAQWIKELTLCIPDAVDLTDSRSRDNSTTSPAPSSESSPTPSDHKADADVVAPEKIELDLPCGRPHAFLNQHTKGEIRQRTTAQMDDTHHQ